MKSVIVIGAGPAGVSCAHTLTKLGAGVQVFEASDCVGGMARSFDLFGQRVDCGPHRFFSKQRLINEYFHEVVGDDYTLVDRLTRIYYRNRYFYYPLKLGNVLANLPFTDVVKILASYARRRLNPIPEPKSFEDWVTNRFGDKLFGIFFKTYSEKLWGIPCSRIDAGWAAQRIKSLSLLEAVKAAIWKDKEQKHKTLVDQFAYPHGGTGMIYEKSAAFIREAGNEIHLNTPVRRVLLDDAGGKAVGVALADGREYFADHVVSTMPLTLLLKGLPDVPERITRAADALYFRNTILVYLEVDSDHLFKDNWIYIHSDEVRHGRITNFRNWCPTLYGDKKTSILCLEFWCFDRDPVWQDDDEVLAQMAREEVRSLGLIPDAVPIVNDFVLRIPRCYPVYETGYSDHLDVIVDYLKPIESLTPIGRYGSFKYNNQDHSILMGILAARNIAGPPDEDATDLWQINTDTEYQEEGKIKDVLVQ